MKKEITQEFNPNNIAPRNGNIFSLPFNEENAKVVILPAPWAATVSFRAGTADGPAAVLEASPQIDFYDADAPDAWKKGIFMPKISAEWAKKGRELRKKAEKVIEFLEKGGEVKQAFRNSRQIEQLYTEINQGGAKLNEWVKEESARLLDSGKIVGVLGGEHGVGLGLMRALGEKERGYGVLHFDAHLDLRDKYERFEFSHASAMRNASEIKSISKFVHLGVRDYCEDEIEFAKNSNGRHVIFSDRYIAKKMFEGENWKNICAEIIKELPQKVFVSFDIDGLNPSLCPDTGTPVPGGLEFNQAAYLLASLVESGREIIGFDLCEVSPRSGLPATLRAKLWAGDWNAIVGSRILYKLACLSGK